MPKSKPIYYNQTDQKIWRTDATIENLEFEYIGSYTQTEYELIIELLFFIFEDRDIEAEQVAFLCEELDDFLNSMKGNPEQ
mgnify:CR=1 FL=1